MVYTGTIVTEAEMALMAGENVDATGDIEANHNILAGHAEAYLSLLFNYDIVTNWATLTASAKAILSEWAARYAAITLIAYNMVAWYNSTSSIIEAEDLIQTHIYRMENIENLIQKVGAKKILNIT